MAPAILAQGDLEVASSLFKFPPARSLEFVVRGNRVQKKWGSGVEGVLGFCGVISLCACTKVRLMFTLRQVSTVLIRVEVFATSQTCRRSPFFLSLLLGVPPQSSVANARAVPGPCCPRCMIYKEFLPGAI